MNICIFEDFFIPSLHPINQLRHTSEMICGAVTLREKAIRYFKPKTVTLYSRNYLVPFLKEKYPEHRVNEVSHDECIFINSRTVVNKRLAKKIIEGRGSALWIKDGSLAAIAAKSGVIDKVNDIFAARATRLDDFRSLDIDIIEAGDDVKMINSPADLVLFHDDELNNDLINILKAGKLKINSKRNLNRTVSYDTTEGPIFVGKGTKIEPFCYIKGPVFIGNNCTIRSGSSIYGPVSIGNECKVSGEITHSILHSYVNKQHLGFLGHSYLCEWVNLGAGTNTSNLKNNYSKIRLNIGGTNVDTNSIFLGSIIGDHTKTGINTMLNTGSIIGLSCNVYGSGYHKNLIKSFTWDNAATGQNIPYQYDKALQTARVSMKRRKVEMSDEYEKMFRFVYESP